MALLALTSLMLAAGNAYAGDIGPDEPSRPPADSTPTGYEVTASVEFSGDAAPASVRTVKVTPTCWWAPAAAGELYKDAAAMLAWYKEQTYGGSRAYLSEYGPLRIWEDAVKAEADGKDMSWHVATCRDPANYRTFTGGCEEDINPKRAPQTWVCYPYKAFPVADGTPDPLVTPADLAAVARDVMVIPEPMFDRSPKVKKAGYATLVGIDTWFWVPDPIATGGDEGTRTIRAQVGQVWAQVEATMQTLNLKSEAAESTSCTPRRARTRWKLGTPVKQACTLMFTKASVHDPEGHRVEATSRWTARWTGGTGPGTNTTGGTLDQVTRSWTDDIRVAEVQIIVTS